MFDKLDKKPRLVIEVDGASHDTKIQKARDERKNKILTMAGIPFVRIKTTSYDCKEIIEKKLRGKDPE